MSKNYFDSRISAGEGTVLRISVEEEQGALWLIVEGRLVGPWVDELQRVCNEQKAPGKGVRMTVDLCGLTAMDTRGQGLLDWLLQRGATLCCSDVMNQYLVEQMARPAGQLQEACRPCRFPSHGDLSLSPEDGRNPPAGEAMSPWSQPNESTSVS
jgi:hypothetical protein